VLHVADASVPDLEEQIAAVREVLEEIGAGHLPEVLALNKCDLVGPDDREGVLRRHPDGVPVSALTGEGVEAVIGRVAETLPSPPIEVDLLVPFDRPELVPWLYRDAQVVTAEETPEGTRVSVRVSEAELPRLQDYILRPVARRSPPGDRARRG
jgi:GTP-binding protein HflX